MRELSRYPIDHSAVIASSGGTSAYASDISEGRRNPINFEVTLIALELGLVAILRLYYHETIGALSSITLLITTQSIGFGLAGQSHVSSCGQESS